jgi:hypothetical protein
MICVKNKIFKMCKLLIDNGALPTINIPDKVKASASHYISINIYIYIFVNWYL